MYAETNDMNEYSSASIHSTEDSSTSSTNEVSQSSYSSSVKEKEKEKISDASNESMLESERETETTSDSQFIQQKPSSGSLKRELPTLESSLMAPTPKLLSAVKFVDAVTIYTAGAALDSHGAVWTWGYNSHGVQGVGLPTNAARYQGGMKRIPYFIDHNIKIHKIWGGYHTLYALSETGTLYAWGRGLEGQMGNGVSGSAGSANPLPVEVDFPGHEKIDQIYPGTESAHCIYAIAESGNVYAWGYQAGGRIPFLSGPNYVTTPTEVSELTDLNKNDKFISMSMGNSHGLIATASGKVYSFGSNGYGQRGNGNTGGSQDLAETTFFSTQKLTPVEVSADLNNSFVLTDQGEIYQFGRLYFESTAGSNYETPQKVEIDTSSAVYPPHFVSLNAGKFATHAVDQYGRVWVWGRNNYYQFGTDGPLYGSRGTTVEYDFRTPSYGKLNTYLSKATQLPKVLGDGDTQYNEKVPKAPVFSNVEYNSRVGFQLTGYENQGMWSDIDDAASKKHPTIYDKKYYKTVGEKGSVSITAPTLTSLRKAHEKVYLVDSDGKRLVYVVRKDSSDTISGNYYVANEAYDGSWFVDNHTSPSLPINVTNETSVPEVKEDERNWIEFATGGIPNDFTGTQNAELGKIASMSSYQSAFQLLDVSGNLYKTGLDGSGAIAWGWDYDPVYDWWGSTQVYPDVGTAARHSVDGLFDYYSYELMFMRGAPRIIPGNISIEAPMEKHYKSQKAKEKVKIDIGLGSAYHSSQLNLTVEPELKETKYLILPYDNNDPNMDIQTPSEEEFNTAYSQANTLGYTAVDLADTNGWKGIKQGLNQSEVKLTDESIEVADNCVVWVFVKTNYYGAEPAVISRKVFDNFYTETAIKHNGIDHAATNEVLYDATAQNVTKMTNDGIEKLIGFPLDKNETIIGTTTTPPTFGYDQAKVAKLSEAEWEANFDTEEIKDEQVIKHRKVVLEKTKADFIASGNNWTPEVESKVIAWIDSWIKKWVEEEWLPCDKQSWKFFTPQATEKTYTLNGVADGTNNENLTATKGELAVCDSYVHSFHFEKDVTKYAKVHYIGVDDEGEKLDPFKMVTEEILRDVSYKRLPPNLLVNDIDYQPIEYKTTNGKPATTFPINVSNATKVGEMNEMIFKAGTSVEEITVSVIYKAHTSITLHARQVIQNPHSSIKRPSNGFFTLDNVQLPNYDQKYSTKNIITNSGDIDKTVSYNEYMVPLQKGYKGISIRWLTPQYYTYLGFVLTEKESEQDIAKIDSLRTIHLDCDNKEVYWLTIYLEPNTTINDYAWDQQTNHFGEIKIP